MFCSLDVLERIVVLSGISHVLSCTPLDLCTLEIGDIR